MKTEENQGKLFSVFNSVYRIQLKPKQCDKFPFTIKKMVKS